MAKQDALLQRSSPSFLHVFENVYPNETFSWALQFTFHHSCANNVSKLSVLGISYQSTFLLCFQRLGLPSLEPFSMATIVAKNVELRNSFEMFHELKSFQQYSKIHECPRDGKNIFHLRKISRFSQKNADKSISPLGSTSALTQQTIFFDTQQSIRLSFAGLGGLRIIPDGKFVPSFAEENKKKPEYCSSFLSRIG